MMRSLTVLLAILWIASGCRLLNGVVECASDADCEGFGACVDGVCASEEGEEGEGEEGEGEEGEGEGEGEEGEGEEGAGEGEGEGEGEVIVALPAGIISIVQFTLPAKQATCAGTTVLAEFPAEVGDARRFAVSTTSNALTVEPATLVLTPGDTVVFRFTWQVGLPGVLDAQVVFDDLDDESAPLFSVPVTGTIDAGSSVTVEIPPVATADLLLVVDGSGSMRDQISLDESRDRFLEVLLAAPAPDLRVGFVDLDGPGDSELGPFGQSRLCGGAAFVETDLAVGLRCAFDDLWDTFSGAGAESPLRSMTGFLAGPGFLRREASLHVVYFGDSNAESVVSAADVIDDLDGLILGSTRSVFVHVIGEAGVDEDCASQTADPKLSAVRDAFEGEGASICDVAARNNALATIATRVRVPLRSVFVPLCDAGEPVVCVKDGDRCDRVAGATVASCTVDLPASVPLAGQTVVVATGDGC